MDAHIVLKRELGSNVYWALEFDRLAQARLTKLLL